MAASRSKSPSSSLLSALTIAVVDALSLASTAASWVFWSICVASISGTGEGKVGGEGRSEGRGEEGRTPVLLAFGVLTKI